MRYVKIYRDAIIAAVVMVLMIVAAPILVNVVLSYVTASAATALLKSRSLVTFGMQFFFFIVGAVVIWFLVRAQAGVLAERYIEPEAVNTYRQMRDSGIDPVIAHRVVSASMEMEPNERTKDWEQANQPNFSAEIAQSLSVDRETRKMMRDFFVTNSEEKDARKSFSTSTQISIENDRIQKSHVVDGVVEPLLNKATPPPPIIAEQARPVIPPPPAELDKKQEPAPTYLPPPPIVVTQPPVVDDLPEEQEPESPEPESPTEEPQPIEEQPVLDFFTPQAKPKQPPVAEAEPLPVEDPVIVEEPLAVDDLRPETVDEPVTCDESDEFVPPPPPPIIVDGNSLFNMRPKK
ncbi:MAG: hypothetical protein ACYCU8_00090 [Ferrimicrobium acidiphilum]